MTSFFQKLEDRVRRVNSLLCVGLDPHPADLASPSADAARTFCRDLIAATSDLAAAYKPNAAFFEAFGFQGVQVLQEVIAAIPSDIPVILDATNLSERHRERLYNIAEHLNARLILVRVEAPPDLVLERLKARSGRKEMDEKSDADWLVYQKMKPTAEKINRNHYVVDTSGDISSVLDKIVRAVNR